MNDLLNFKRETSLGDMGSWCSEHPILTFLLAGSAISAVVNIVKSFKQK